jgi:pyrimidine deaminase RibD-like protein
MQVALGLARRCRPSDAAFSVGALVVTERHVVVGVGFSRETGPSVHAEEVALRRAGRHARGATLFSTMEPCGGRRSGRRSCADRIAAAGVRTVYVAAAEPPVFVEPAGLASLREAGVRVVRMPRHAAAALAVNAHLLPRPRSVREGGRKRASRSRLRRHSSASAARPRRLGRG